MDRIKVSKTDPGVRAVVDATFPSYRGRKIVVCPTTRPIDVTSFWDGGSRSYYAAVDLRSLPHAPRVLPVPQNGTPFDGGPVAPRGVQVPVGFAVVEHCIFSGHDMGIRIHVHPDTLPRFLPAAS